MKISKLLLGLSILGISFSVFAQDIYCPAHLICTNNECSSPTGSPPNFRVTIDPVWSPVPDGTLYFGQASSNINASRTDCQYRDAQGHTWAFLTSSKFLRADMSKQPNVWHQFGSDDDYYCSLNDTPPYLGNPEYCPFKSAN